MRESADGPDVRARGPQSACRPTTPTSVSLVDVSRDGKHAGLRPAQGRRGRARACALLDVDTRQDVPGGLPKARYFGVSYRRREEGLLVLALGAGGLARLVPPLRRRPRAGHDRLRRRARTRRDPVRRAVRQRPLARDRRVHGLLGRRHALLLRDGVESNGAIVTVTDTLHALVNVDIRGRPAGASAPTGRRRTAASWWSDATQPRPQNWKRDRRPSARTRSSRALSAAGGRLYVTVPARTWRASCASTGSTAQAGVASCRCRASARDRRPAGEWARRRGATSRSPRSTSRPRSTATSSPRATPRRGGSRPAPFDPDASRCGRSGSRARTARGCPMFVVQRKGLALDGTHPRAAARATAASTSARRPRSRPFVAAWLELGGVYVLREPARRRRVRRGLAPRRHARRTSSTCSTTSSPPRSG